ncbi:4'-phosphopantetheinyl transferase superfamily protein [Sagittula sp. NFXS13]|uniref:4'-phosphopantetheinyl transferase family protein n=1 Tax=Sagittula sp. NFXS13 TaxID=2819095 RepID=UPI0032DE69FC
MTAAATASWLTGETCLVRTTDEVLLTAQYDVARYDPFDFDRHGVVLPPEFGQAVAKRQAEFLAGRVLAKRAMTLLGSSGAPPTRGALGEPLFAKGVRGSISHSQGRVGVWVTRRPCDLGLDIEHLAAGARGDAIRQVALTEAERAMQLSDAAVTTAFSAKEALYKALFPTVGRRFGFDAAELLHAPDASRARLRLTRNLAPGLPAGQILTIKVSWTGKQVMTQCTAGPFGQGRCGAAYSDRSRNLRMEPAI